MTEDKQGFCKCYPEAKPGIAIQVESFNPLICYRCKKEIEQSRPSEIGEKELTEIILNHNGRNKKAAKEIVDLILPHFTRPQVSEEKIKTIFLRIAKRVQVNDEENEGHWRWAWIIDYDELSTAIASALRNGELG